MGCSSDERKIVYFAQKTVEVCSGIALHWLKYVFFFFEYSNESSINFYCFSGVMCPF